jgi:gliding motility-associated-like protein
LPIILQLPEELLVGFGETITLKPFVNLDMDEIGSVQWAPAAGLSCADCLFPMVSVSQDAEYTVTVTDNNGCAATASVQLRVDLERGIYAPNTFSPNGDGINDRFQLFGKDGQVRSIRRMMIWSRWGESVFEVKDGLLNAGWDGTARGKQAPAGVYTWYAEVEWVDGRSTFVQGALTLIR